MKKVLAGIILVLVIIGAFIYYTFSSTGYFREIENEFSGVIRKSVAIPGVEDMQISYTDNFILFGSDDRASRRDGNPVQGQLYYMDLDTSVFDPILLTAGLDFTFYPHGLSMVRIGPGKYKVLVVNHPPEGHTIEVFDFEDYTLTHVKTLKDVSMVSPNDVVAIDSERFYFTNDHGYTQGLSNLGEEYLGWSVSNVIYFDGEKYREVAGGIAYANGINLDRKRNLMFVASPRDFQVNVYSRNSNGDLAYVETIDCGTGVDNITFDPNGKIWIAGHPSLLTFTAYARDDIRIAPSEVITIDYRGTGDNTTESVFLDNGENISGSSVAVVYSDYIFVGNVMDDHFLILQQK